MPWERPATRHVAAGVHGPACGALRCLAMPPTQPTRRWTPGYRRLWSATATSAVGTGMTTAAIPLVAALRPDSEFLLGAVAAAGLLPGLLLSIPAGVAADRWDRRRIMIWADLVRAVAIAAAALVLATSTLPAVALAALAFVVGAGETLFITASQSTLPSLVADDALDEANGHLQAATDGGREFVGPPIGSWLFHLVKWAPFAGDAVTYAASAAILAGVPPTADAPASPSPASPSRASPAAPDGSAGHGDGIGPAWRFLRGHRTLAVLAGALVVLSMSGAAVLALLVLVVTERWGLDDAWFGVALTLVACGGAAPEAPVAPAVDVNSAELSLPDTVFSFGDAGAHVTAACDFANTTFALVHWGRDRAVGFRKESIVHRQTGAQAKFFGFADRGEIRVGANADINVIDFGRLRLDPPRLLHDFPGGAKRLHQGASGYIATLVNGVPTVEADELTGALPGRILRS